MVEVFREVKRVLRPDGTLFLNLGDSYFGSGGAHKNDINPGISRSYFRGGIARESSVHHKSGIFFLHKAYPDYTTQFPNRQVLKPKDLCGIPWRVAFALQTDGWYLRSDIIWHKPNPMPESVTDRPTKSHEYIFLLTKSAKYYYNAEAIKERTLTFDSSSRDRDNTKLNNTPGRSRMAGLKTNQYNMKNKRSVWTVNIKPYKEAHFATFPPEIPRTCILAGSKTDDIILDPFAGALTTMMVAQQLSRQFIGIELNESYIKIGINRLSQNYFDFG